MKYYTTSWSKLRCRRTSSQYQCDDTVLSTVTIIVWTHQLHCCHDQYVWMRSIVEAGIYHPLAHTAAASLVVG